MWNRKDLKRRDFLRDCAVGVGVMSGPG
ncbi:MAG: twin-arginine translocation signal domain-containing protein, partial [Candidatus Aminicenantes bacterium]|nr:twin-arginine translocation signal domain-containing protein [Candidatus Aminicenantes bacterium]